MMSFPFRRVLRLSLVGLLSVPASVFARQLGVSIGTPFNLATIVTNVVNFLAATITSVATAMFLVGAFMIVLSGAKEDFKQKGKDLMIGSIISIAVVLGAYGIYRTVGYFLL